MENGWYFGLDNQVVGPVDLQQLLDFLRSSEQWRRVLVWHEGFEEWKPVKDIPEISAQMTAKGPPPLPAPPVEPPPPAPVAVEAPPTPEAEPTPAPATTPTQAAEPPAPVPTPVVNVAPVVSIVPDTTPAQPITPPVEAPKPAEAVATSVSVAAAPVVPAPPAAAEPAIKPKRRRGRAAVLMVIGLSAAGVLGYFSGRRDILSSFTKAPDIAAPPAQAKESPANDATIGRSFASVLQATTASLPKKIDDWTVMYDVTASGRRLVYHYTLDTTKYLVPPNFAVAMKQKMLAEACGGPLGDALKAGGSVEYRYHTQALFFVGNFDIAGGDCGAQSVK